MWHLGLGDSILCNGLLRSLHQEYRVTTFCKHFNHDTLLAMFGDLKDINIIKVANDSEAMKFVNDFGKFYDEYLGLGFFGKDFLKNSKLFDESFYRQAGVSYNKRWSLFKCPDNQEKQDELYSNIKKKYIFVHDDPSRGYSIHPRFLPDKNVYRPKHNLGNSSNYTVFDYRKIIENAEEIHCMDSSFACYIDHLPGIKNKLKYIHRYIRKDGGPLYKNNWKFVKQAQG